MKDNTKQRLKQLFAGLGIMALFLVSFFYAVPANSGLPSLTNKDFKLGLDLQGGVHLVYEANMDSIAPADRAAALQGVRDVIERRVNAFGIAEPIVQTNISGGNYRIIIELAGVFDVEDAISLIGETPILEFKVPATNPRLEVTPEIQAQVDSAQRSERESALLVLNRARSGEDFAELAREFSIDPLSRSNDGYVGFVDENDSVFGELVNQITRQRYRPGIIRGLYETDRSLHIINFLGTRRAVEADLSHILFCHSESQGCTNEVAKDDAKNEAEYVRGILSTINFEQLAQEYSDDTGSAQNGGSLGSVRQGMMVEAFENAYLSMRNGQISEIVETEFGFHLIYRKASRNYTEYEISQIEMPFTTAFDFLDVDPWENTGLSGKNVRNASVGFDQSTSNPIPLVFINFDAEGGKLFEEITTARVGDVIGIFLDGQPISTPIVQQPIYGGSATISGNFTIQDARLLAQRLNAGALPVPVELLSQQTVGPTLGAVSLEKSINAAIIGLIAVGLFMIAYYRLAGLISVIALIIYMTISLSAYKLLGITITLAGIAGFVLSIGMAVDANVLIFERLREELRSGRDLQTAIDEATRRAWTSIRDGNITTIIASLILFFFSTSFIKGFALTLGVGIILSMFTAIVITRYLLKTIGNLKIAKANWLYNASKK
jgi:protein-export membrane protein SecD